MEVAQDDSLPWQRPRQQPVDHRERTICRRHERPPDQIHDGHFAQLRRHRRPAPPRTARGQIRGADYPPFLRDEPRRVFLVPNMVAERDDVRAGVEQLARNLRRDPLAPGRVLRVDDDDVQRRLAPKPGNPRLEQASSRASDNIADAEHSHGVSDSKSALRVRASTHAGRNILSRHFQELNDTYLKLKSICYNYRFEIAIPILPRGAPGNIVASLCNDALECLP